MQQKTQAWTEEDLRLLAHYYSEKVPVYFIANKLGRTKRAVQQQALRTGCSSGMRSRAWEQEEIDLLENSVGNLPLRQVMNRLKGLWSRKGWSGRSRIAVTCKINQLGYSKRLEGNFYSLRQIAEALRCSTRIPRDWVKDKEMAKILKPKIEAQTTYIHHSNLREFMRKYPGEIAKCAPDIVWLFSVVFEG